MSQISPPFRIAIVAMLAVCGVWFTVLKPKDPAAVSSTTTAPGTTGLAHDVSAAKGAAAASNAANAKVQAATGGTPATTAKSARTAKPAATAKAQTTTAKPHAAVVGETADAAKPADAKAKAATDTDPAAPLLSAIAQKKAVVLVFWNDKGTLDHAVRRAAGAAARHHGKVVVKVASIADVGRYGAITNGVKVMQSPTVLVLAPGNTARAIAGFTTTSEIDQTVADALAGK